MNNRIKKLEEKVFQSQANAHPTDESTRRARNYIESVLPSQNKFISSVCWKWVPSHYYTLSLKDRAAILQASSTNQLCKSMLMENRAYKPDSPSSNNKRNDFDLNRTNSRFYLVVVQYEAVINAKKLESEIRGLRPFQSGLRLSKTDLDFQMASSEDNDKVTGYKHNSVTPFGLLDTSVPVILSKAIVEQVKNPAFIWMGGGHVDLKLGMAVCEFVTAMDALVLDVSDIK